MIFRQIEEIKAGKKIQTRRVVKPGEWFWLDDATLMGGQHRVYRGDKLSPRLVWQIGKTYAIVPKRGKPAIKDGRIRVLDIFSEPLHSINYKDAIEEGVESVEEYRALWESINGKRKGARWQDNPEVWVIYFEYVPAQQ